MDVRIEGLSVKYGDVLAVDGLSLDIKDGEFLSLLGPSGCGKTSTMRALVGLEEPTAGTITVGGRTIFDSQTGVDVPTNKRDIGMVFQSYAIWPHRNVFDNVSFPLTVRRLSKSAVRERTMEALSMVGLAHFATRGAGDLSGGQMQRVALARSLAMRPSVILLDEPLSNLDAKLRERLRFELRELQQELGLTALYVTHDQTEAMAMSDRIAIMREGHIAQLGSPEDLYRSPKSLFVADFMGTTNLFEAEVVRRSGNSGRVRLSGSDQELDVSSAQWPNDEHVIVAIRPDDVKLRQTGGSTNELKGQLKVWSYLGSQARFKCDLGGGVVIEGLVPWDRQHPSWGPGDPMTLSVDAESPQLFDAESRATVTTTSPAPDD